MSTLHPNDSAATVRSVERALDLLMVIETASRPMRLSDVARASGIHLATTQRLLQVLERRELVQRANGRYLLGRAVVPLTHAFLVTDPLSQAALPVLQRLTAAAGATASLFERVGSDRVMVQRVSAGGEAAYPLEYALPIGRRQPMHIGVGKVIAAYFTPPEQNELLDSAGEVRYASGEVHTREQLLAELRQIRRDGYMLSIGERTLGTVLLAAPVLTPEGRAVAAVSVTWPLERHTPDRAAELAAEVRGAARAIADRAFPGSDLTP